MVCENMWQFLFCCRQLDLYKAHHHGTMRQPGQGWPGQARPGLAWPGQARPGQAWPGQAWPGQAWPGLAWPGLARPGHAPVYVVSFYLW